MILEAAGSDRLAFESPRSSTVSTESGIELSQTYPEQYSHNYHPARNSSPSLPCIAPYDGAPLVFDAGTETVVFPSSAAENSDAAPRQYFSQMIPELARHPWTESTEFIELWGDITSKTINHPQDFKEQKCSESDGTSVPADTNLNSSLISWVLRKQPWTASTEFVELWSDIPCESDTNLNRSEGRKEFMDQTDDSPFQNTTAVSKDASDVKQCPGIYMSSFTEFDKLTDVSSIAPDDSISNHNYSRYPGQDKVACCRIFSECFCDFRSFTVSYRNEILVLVMKVLLSLIPISAICMGAIHFGTCSGNDGVTLLVFLTGIAGVFLAIVYIANHFTNDLKVEIRKLINIFRTITAVLLMIEMIVFYSMSVSFENSGNYCDRTFYIYTFFMNIAAAGIVFLSVLLQCTSCKHQVNIEAF